MRPATYASALLRAHLRKLSPLPKDELLALKRSISDRPEHQPNCQSGERRWTVAELRPRGLPRDAQDLRGTSR